LHGLDAGIQNSVSRSMERRYRGVARLEISTASLPPLSEAITRELETLDNAT